MLPTSVNPPSDPWEAAYNRFETPKEEVRKFRRRLLKLGAAGWRSEAEIVELFCGRGSGLHALSGLGFSRVEGVDLSPSLLAQYSGPGKCYVQDCRQLPFSDSSKDVVIVQGGLHHLSTLPDDLDRSLREIYRVMREDGLVVLVEPWITPFLSLVHFVCRQPIARRLSNRIEALAVMIHHERRTYEQWLSQPDAIMDLLQQYFIPHRRSTKWGKLRFVGHKRPHAL